MEKSNKITTAVAATAALLTAAAALKRRYYLLSEVKGLKDEDMPEITIPSGYKKLIKLQSVQAGLYGVFVEELSKVKKMYSSKEGYTDKIKAKNVKFVEYLESELELDSLKEDFNKTVKIQPKVIDAARFVNATKNIEAQITASQALLKDVSKLVSKDGEYNGEYKKAVVIIVDAFKLHIKLCKEVLRIQKNLLDVIERKSGKGKKLGESVLNEIAILNKDYQANKKVYDEAFKKGLPVWEAKANKKGFKPIDSKKAAELLNQTRLGVDTIQLIEKLKEIKIGKWTLLVGNNKALNDGSIVYSERGPMNIALVLAQKANGKATLRNFPFRRFLNWDSSKVK